MKSVAACVSLLILLTAQIESRATTQQLSTSKSISKVSRIHRHHHQTSNDEHDSVDDPTQELAVVQEKTGKSIDIIGETARRMVKRSTETPVEKPSTIDWKLLVAYLTEIALKLIEFVSNNLQKLQQRLMHFLAPLFSTISDQQPSGHPAVAATTSINWRSAGTALFNTLLKFQSMRKNEVW